MQANTTAFHRRADCVLVLQDGCGDVPVNGQDYKQVKKVVCGSFATLMWLDAWLGPSFAVPEAHCFSVFPHFYC